MSKIFEHDQPVRFSHCDPAGIVYFPRFFDMAHAAMEDWFTYGLGHDHAELLTVEVMIAVSGASARPPCTSSAISGNPTGWGRPCATKYA